MSAKVRRGDTVTVIAGKDAGKQGKVLRVDPKRERLFVEGLNMVKRHQRPRSLKDTQRGGKVGGVIEKEGPIHISNVMVMDPRENKATRVRIERTAGGKRERVAVRSGQKLTESS